MTATPSQPRAETVPAVKSIVIGTAGHIDHGKTALVYALTGTNTDRLPEEKQRGITIDLGFAALRLPDGGGGDLDVSLIDVPGHHAFIRNMLAGAGTIDAVMLVIAADEGVKAQTEEHLAICSLLGIRRGLVALTKKDAVSAQRLRDTRDVVHRFLQHTFLEGAKIVPVSAWTGEGVDTIKAALATLAAEASARSGDFVPRLPLDRVFSMRGFGTVVTGTLQSGTLKAGEHLEGPGGRTVRVRGVQVHGESRDAAHAPCRVALNLADVEVGDLRRGDTLTLPRTLTAATALDAKVSILAGMPPLKHRSKVRLHAFTSETPATILLYDCTTVAPGETALARIQLARGVVVLPGDRFVLRRCSPAMTIGGGVVLDAHPPARWKKSTALRWLREMKDAGVQEQLRLRIARRGSAGLVLADLMVETGLTEEAIRRHVEPLIADERVAMADSDTILGIEALRAAMDAICAELGKADAVSMSRAELKSRNRFEEAAFAMALDRLHQQKKIEIHGDMLSLAGRGEQISEAQRRRLNAIESMYAAAGLAAPLLSEVSGRTGIPAKEMHGLITMLLRSKRLVRMGADNAFVHPRALEELYAGLRKHRGQQFDVGRFKSFTGLTRKHAIPLLEHLDQARVTRNVDGIRVVL